MEERGSQRVTAPLGVPLVMGSGPKETKWRHRILVYVGKENVYPSVINDRRTAGARGREYREEGKNSLWHSFS